MNIKELNDQELVRLEKLKKYQELGIDPFGQKYKVSHSFSEIRELCKEEDAVKLEKFDLHVSVAGRIKRLKNGQRSYEHPDKPKYASVFSA